MNTISSQRRLSLAMVLSIAIVTLSWSDPQPPDTTTPSAPEANPAAMPHDSSKQSNPDALEASHAQTVGTAPAPRATKIIGLCDANGNKIDQGALSSVGLSDTLWVVVQSSVEPTVPDTATAATLCKGSAAKNAQFATQLDANQYALFFNGRELEALDGTLYDSARHAFGFRLTRNDKNKAVWNSLLGSPTTTLHRPVVVALGTSGTAKSPQPTITGDDLNASFQLRMFSPQSLAIAVAATLVLLYLVWGHAKTRTTLRDNLLPQLEATRQPYSLGRWQMAFWFTLIFISFLFLFILLWDTNTVSTQALALMGISGATALAAVAVDAVKNSPADDANRGLQALGLNSYDDVLRVRQEITARQAELATLPPRLPPSQPTAPPSADARRKQLQSEIQDRNVLLRTYEDKVRPFVSQGWFADITTDLNGMTLHRLQVFCWTIALGVVFLISVYRELSMPDYNATLLALMGISSAGYIGFKIPESNN